MWPDWPKTPTQLSWSDRPRRRSRESHGVVDNVGTDAFLSVATWLVVRPVCRWRVCGHDNGAVKLMVWSVLDRLPMEEDTFIKSDVSEFVAASLVNSGGRNGVDARFADFGWVARSHGRSLQSSHRRLVAIVGGSGGVVGGGVVVAVVVITLL